MPYRSSIGVHSSACAADILIVDFGALVVFRGEIAPGAEPDGVGCPKGADGFVGYRVGGAQVGEFEVRVQLVGGLVRVEDEDVGGFEIAVD